MARAQPIVEDPRFAVATVNFGGPQSTVATRSLRLRTQHRLTMSKTSGHLMHRQR